MNIKLEIPASFFEGEERCGYYVSPEMKKVWAVQLDLIAEFARVCEKYGIRWWADAGTLLGAARHKGFIPWDDDMDVILMRKEYERLRTIPPEEFQYPYRLQLEEDWSTGRFIPLFKMYNLSTTMESAIFKQKVDAGEKLTGNYIASIFIDIFPLDNLPDDDAEMNALCRKLHSLALPTVKKNYNRLLRWTDYYKPHLTLWKRPLKAALHGILKPINPFLDGLKENLRKRSAVYDREFMRVLSSLNYPEGKRVAKLVFSNAPNFVAHRVWDRSYFDETVYLPFEMLSLPAPSRYDELLTKFYGNWHEYVIRYRHADFYDTEHPYTYYTQEGHLPQ